MAIKTACFLNITVYCIGLSIIANVIVVLLVNMLAVCRGHLVGVYLLNNICEIMFLQVPQKNACGIGTVNVQCCIGLTLLVL